MPACLTTTGVNIVNLIKVDHAVSSKLHASQGAMAIVQVGGTFAPAANFLACSTPLAANVQNTSESFACSLGLFTVAGPATYWLCKVTLC